jgi:Yip1 domain
MASFLQIFFDPGAVFAKVKERGSWAAPLIAMALITMITSFYVTHTIGMENITRRFFDEHPSFASRIPPDKLEQSIQQSASPTRVAIGSITGGLGIALMALIVAVVLMVMLSIMDRKPQLPKILGTVAWASFPFVVIGTIMSLLILLITKDPTELDPATLLATSVGSFLDKNSTGKFVYSLAGSFDLLAIGKVFLLSFGIGKVTGLAFGRALTLVMGLWLFWVLLRGGIAAATGF